MNFDQATENLPANVRSILDATIADNHLSKTDAFVYFFIAQLQLTVFMERRRRTGMLIGFSMVAIFGMILTGALGVYYGRSTIQPRSLSMSLPTGTTMDGKDVLVIDMKTWQPQALIHADKAYLFP